MNTTPPLQKKLPANSSFNLAALHKPVVMTHQQMGLDLLKSIQRNTDNDQQTRSAEE
jgi:hypothetical protein